MKHTPGPWKATDIPFDRIVCIVQHDDYENDDWFVTSEAHRATPEEDAHLIAAAPDLLEALEWLVNAWDGIEMLAALGDGLDGAPLDFGARERAEAAIAKARGDHETA